MDPSPTLQTLPASVLLLIAHLLSPPLLKHTFRPPGYRTWHRSLLAASTTCHTLRRICFPLAIRIFRNHDRKPLSRADIGESASELEKRIEWLMGREDLWGYVKMVDIELFARGSCSLAKNLATLLSVLPNLQSVAVRLPTYRVFRDALTSDMRSSFSNRPPITPVQTLCLDAHSAWLVPHFPNVRELVVWSWPKPGTCEEDDRADGWKLFLASINAQAPKVNELEIGGLSIWDVNEMFPSLANLLGNVEALRVLHRSEPYGAVPVPSGPLPPIMPAVPLSPTIRAASLPPAVNSSTRVLWEDSQTSPEYEGQYICGHPGTVKRIIYFGLQDECGSCYIPPDIDTCLSRGYNAAGRWKDVEPAVVLNAEDMKDRS
ncbi:hypothetical protein FRC11_011763 [Ceratobasidium sp. 423]|nr:hypothetical protein FRC11_011763 [Ceratobasidium sp. 423]